MRYVYRHEPSGEAVNIRREGPDYVLTPGEEEIESVGMPDAGQLHGIDFQRGLAYQAIDTAAEAARLRYITPGAGQALTYLEKERDARAYAAAGYPSTKLTDYPWVDAERQATGQTGKEAADTVIATADAWRATGAEIDGARRAGKLAVEGAADVAEIEAARDAAVAALEGM